MQELIKIAREACQVTAASLPDFKVGDTVNVYVKIQEKQKERIQQFQGVVIQIRGEKDHIRHVTVRKKKGEIAVERIFPIPSAVVEKIEVKVFGVVRRAKLFYLRHKKGSAAKVKTKAY